MAISRRIGILIGTAAVLAVVFLPSYLRLQSLKAKNAAYERKIRELRMARIRLEEERRLLEEDPVYLEKVAREKMGLIKEGEVIYKITPPEAAAEVAAAP